MLKAANVTTPNGQQTALAEIEACSNLPTAAAALEFEVQRSPVFPVNNSIMTQHQAAAEEPIQVEEFNLFRDYFGLINLVKGFANVPDDLISHSNTSYLSERHERRDSLGSAGSEFSSSNSAESVEVADIYYNAYTRGAERLVRMKQAFGDYGEEEGITTTTIIPSSFPSSLFLEHKIIAATTAKKPQVCLYIIAV